jgi:heme/copper-type cytochrome/quinol oxidase subunit 3
METHHGKSFFLIIGMHAAIALGSLGILTIVWSRLAPLHEDPLPGQRSISSGAVRAACIPWYFVVVVWPVLLSFSELPRHRRARTVRAAA